MKKTIFAIALLILCLSGIDSVQSTTIQITNSIELAEKEKPIKVEKVYNDDGSITIYKYYKDGWVDTEHWPAPEV